ncbi:sulfite exporter TauE/SafE family protein [Candidatus Magnetomonas plexicatena]|uniref:sulfite exporter TauE/SafE family protein n=1 Tax=Candidatus Magnetomonas plexicatena TaxID=2552947 RepID=UPI001C76887E|nr:sulfite exporter TauE/SafE family protein [Nitrospirales bacterium LBB_01]
MSNFRRVFMFLEAASKAHAKWEYDISLNIIKNRKKMFILLLLLLPIVAVSAINAADVIGGHHAYAPVFYSNTIFFVSIAVGLAAGLITGCIGAGGGFIITPALMAAGVKGILAVGTDMFHIFAKAIMGTTIHKKLGNVSVKLAIAFLVGSAGGTVIGGSINKALYNKSPILSDAFISTIYTLLLGFLGFYAMADYLRSRKGPSSEGGAHDAHGSMASGTPSLPMNIQAIRIPPMIAFDEDYGGKEISWLFIALGGGVVGILAAIMGVGGGFITFPMFVYIFGVSTATTVGTDILQIIFTAGFSSIGQYAINGYVFYSLAMGMLVGSLIGIQIGALTTKVVKGIQIRGFYAISILAGFINRATTLPKKLVELEYIQLGKPIVTGIENVGNIIFWIVIGIFGVWIFSKFFGNMGKLREDA